MIARIVVLESAPVLETSGRMLKFRSHLFAALLAVWTSIFAPVLWILLATRPPAPFVRRITRIWSNGVLFLLRHVVGLGYTFRGRENMPADPCLIVSNHQSAWETIAFVSLFPDVAIITKEELLKIPVFGGFLRISPMITIDRESGGKAIRKMVEESATALAEGRSVLIFPEGTRSEPGAPVEFKRGVELLYAKLGRPMLPVAMNSGDFWQSGRRNKRAGSITVSCLPVVPSGLNAGEAIKMAEAAVQTELDLIRAGRV